MFGTDIWLDAAEARRKHLLTGAQFRAELTNLMRWRLQEDLGYWMTLTFQVTNTGGSEVFDMIFATDHRVGLKIMTDLYNAARRRQPVLHNQAQLQRRDKKLEDDGIQALFELSELGPAAAPPPAGLYEVQPQAEAPHMPYLLPR